MHQSNWSKVRAQGITSKAVDASASEVVGEAAGELVVDTERGRDQCGRYQR